MGKIQSLYLVAEPSFIEGVSRIFDFAGNMTVYNESDTPEEADLQALRADWEALAGDMRSAVGSVMTSSLEK
jgi:hypothetical protein